MNISSFHNPNGKIYEVDSEDSAPGTRRKILGIGIFLLSLYLFFAGFSTKSSVSQDIQNTTQSINTTKANLEKTIKARIDAESVLKNITEEYQQKKSVLDNLSAKHKAEFSEKLARLEQREKDLNSLIDTLYNEYGKKNQAYFTASSKAADASYSKESVLVVENMQKELSLISENKIKSENELRSIKNEELPEIRALLDYPQDLYKTATYMKAEEEWTSAEEAMRSATIAYEAANNIEKNSRNNIVNLQNSEARIKAYNESQTKTMSLYFALALMGIGLGIFMVRSGIKATKEVEGRNPNYIINSINNTFFLPYSDTPYCQLSDIDAVNKRVETEKRRESYRESVNGKMKEKHRTVTDYTYYVQIIGAGISEDFEFDEQGNRDALYSSLKAGIKDIRDYLR